ncbi:MAG TPA: hypothetical protein VFT19_13775 [Solirubrobacterales bacterium]|nr:hypothetical protein [Solirubrobacterales bacterium]
MALAAVLALGAVPGAAAAQGAEFITDEGQYPFFTEGITGEDESGGTANKLYFDTAETYVSCQKAPEFTTSLSQGPATVLSTNSASDGVCDWGYQYPEEALEMNGCQLDFEAGAVGWEAGGDLTVDCPAGKAITVEALGYYECKVTFTPKEGHAFYFDEGATLKVYAYVIFDYASTGLCLFQGPGGGLLPSEGAATYIPTWDISGLDGKGNPGLELGIAE